MENIKNYFYMLIFILLGLFAYEGIEKRIKDTFFENEPFAIDFAKPKTKNIYEPNETSIQLPVKIEPNSVSKENNTMERDPNLVGRWYLQQPGYKSGGLNTETYIYFFSNGTFKQTSQTHGILDGYDTESTIVYEPEEEPNIKAMMVQGYRWYAQNGKFCFKDSQGNIFNCHDYSFENQYLFIRYAGSQKPSGYTRSN